VGKTKTVQKDPEVVGYLAKTGLTYWSQEIQTRIFNGEQIPIPERGEEHRVEMGELMTSEQFHSRMALSKDWLIEQGLVEVIYSEEDTDGEVQ